MSRENDNAEFDNLVAEQELTAKQKVKSSLPVKWEVPKPPAIPVNAGKAAKRIRQMNFLRALAECGMITLACKAADINVMTEQRWRKEGDPWYMEQFKTHLQMYRDAVQAEVHDRAINGVETPIVGKKQVQIGKDINGNPIFGQEDRIIGTKKVKSDLLLMFHAKRVIPEYRDKYEPPKEDDSTPKTTDSPMVRITMRLDMISGRQQGQIDSKQVRLIGGGNETIEITPEIRNITPEKEPEQQVEHD